MRTYSIEYRIKNAARIAKHNAEYYQANKARIDTRNAAWRQAHPKAWMEIHNRWLANKKGALINDFTSDQWLELLLAFNFRCAYCPPGCPECRAKTHDLTEDHITPLSKRGPNTLHNLVPCCRSCNSKKGTKDVPQPVQPLLLTIAPAKSRRSGA